jgi:hypothetical protein
MKIIANLIGKYLQQTDIEGLIQLGTPSDEYSSEAEVISLALTELGQRANAESITAIISEVWKNSFDLTPTELAARYGNINKVSEMILKTFD